ncbi:hypothetical protein P0Y35_15120 [Kiritimatiellaeota bacterium B1221]|nr:hypothetical protein [Kiritimatiellaeota bacterium B1221]
MKDFHCIKDFDRMPPFFMSLVSASDIWAFISSTGGLTAGRKDAEHALFPYTTDDRITENAGNTGPITLIRLPSGKIWQPFSSELPVTLPRQRNLYKHISGDALCFEEVLEEPALAFKYTWRTSPKFGLVRKVEIKNLSDTSIKLDYLDGVQNLLPAGVTTQVQLEFSNLLDAYKRSFLEEPGTLALYTMSSLLTDLAEPSEALRCTTAWSLGLPSATTLICSDQIQNFRSGEDLKSENDVIARRGAFLSATQLTLPPGQNLPYYQIFDVEQDHSDVAALQVALSQPATLLKTLEQDIADGTADLFTKISGADGCQCTEDAVASDHHFSNVVFNCMRGGLFPDGPQIRKHDLALYVETWRKGTLETLLKAFASEPELMEFTAFQSAVSQLEDPDLQRLCNQYLPLTFSRRHGDPSRPWNRFSINLTHEDGSPRLDFQGNWRDLFQNLEALLHSCPAYTPQVISCFLNATTLDGYNPYRVTRSGIEWEKPEPDNPWANIGYWGDHQIIYLLKLLETSEKFFPGELSKQLNQPLFSAADVPYRLLPYAELISRNDGTTVLFDHTRDQQVEDRVSQIGADGKMVHSAEGRIIRVSLIEKLLTLTLAKLGNFVPDGGIWMNTQRPEWNDANNALAGRGISVVTLGYLHRHLLFLQKILSDTSQSSFNISPALATWMSETITILSSLQTPPFNDQQRRKILDQLGASTTAYRELIYADQISGTPCKVSKSEIETLCTVALKACGDSLKANRRPDGMYHAYQVLSFTDTSSASIRKLNLMLEGQVSILSSGILSADETLALLKALRQSDLYRPDQHSYILYPDHRPPRFMEKNQLPANEAEAIPFLKTLLEQNDTQIIRKDCKGNLHFHPDFKNTRDLAKRLERYGNKEDHQAVLDLYETRFDHQAFTGRSGSMFGYEGLGSIYWHMVAKLLLAVQECVTQAGEQGETLETIEALKAAYLDVRDGLGFRKSPEVFGAFPTDPYSHTPSHGGAKQPGMTGQVKEEILTRLGETGLQIKNGCVQFNNLLLLKNEFRSAPGTLHWIDLNHQKKILEVPAGSFAYTFNRVPVLIKIAEYDSVTIFRKDGSSKTRSGNQIDPKSSRELFLHQNRIEKICVTRKL